jgi:phosphoribosylformylglycinamidine cyclo-ligase
MTVTYRDAGVDLTVAEEVAASLRSRFQTGLFGGFLPVPQLKSYDSPVLVSSVDGVGTKAHLAARLGCVDGLGLDIVHHCVNDIAVHGAEPLLFLDYLAFHRIDPALVERIVGSIAGACSALGITLAGGETAEMPLVYPEGRFDLAGTIVGVVDQAKIVDGSAIRPGDLLLGLPSTGLHTNGYSLVQHLFYDDEYSRYERSLGVTLGEALLAPHRCYLHEIRCLLATGAVHGLAHITGGGIEGNLGRILPNGVSARIRLPEPAPPLFRYLAASGVDEIEMRAVFNMGIGLIAVCDPAVLQQIGCYPVIGQIEQAAGEARSVVWECSP